MEPITSEAIIRLLNENIQIEHTAIVQFQQHAFLMDENGIRHEVEEIAREAMRHLMWFAEAIAKLGGKPALERDVIFLGTHLVDRLRKDLEKERMVVERYGRQWERIDEPWIKSLLARVLSDEHAHVEKFEKLLRKVEAQPPAVQEPSEESRLAPPAPDHVIELLNQGIGREYTAILQYLYQSFTTPACEIGKELLMIAQEEMKHLAWLAEPVVDRGGVPGIESSPLHLDQSTQEMLQRSIQGEKEAEAQYLSHGEAIPDPKIRRVLDRIKGEEAYQRERLERFLAEMEKGEEKEKSSLKLRSMVGELTVGSLFRQAMK